MMKKVNKLWMLLCLCMVWMMTMNVSAEEYHIYDHADLLTVQEEEYLENLEKYFGIRLDPSLIAEKAPFTSLQ